jgi:hypothetical protein
MHLHQSEFREQLSYEPPILPDSVDSATAFFYAVNQLVRSTPFEASATPACNKTGFAGALLIRLGNRTRAVILSAFAWMCPVKFAAARLAKK